MLDIDPLAKRVPLSIMEYSNILVSGPNKLSEKISEKISEYKIFFTQKFDTTFITRPLFIDEVDSTSKNANDKKAEKKIEMYKFSKNEINFLNSLF
ncbi:MAG: hypothetical protein Homavirus28_6 [Homavirus sp.]|uniref:Uncharacterized protein n=1 Tax=Homavirus sp. TaxID=2487769 RepID=A0A3G5A4Z6_9VIRU|nr:MAG: hypothetical protein Homavirus28_6 [Homavirus sp.]